MIVYIAGPVTGKPLGNRPAFEAAAAILRAQGHEVLNPLDIFTEPPPADPTPAEARAYWVRAMRAVVPALLRADSIAMLPEWKDSEGACWEHLIATEMLGLVPIFVLQGPVALHQQVLRKIDAVEREVTSHWSEELAELEEQPAQELARERERAAPSTRRSRWSWPWRRASA